MAFPRNPNPGDLYYSCGQKFVFNGKMKAWNAIPRNYCVSDLQTQVHFAEWNDVNGMKLPSIEIPQNLLDLR